MRRWFAQGLFGLTVLYTFWLAQAPATPPGAEAEATSPVSVERGAELPEAFLPLLRAWQEKEPRAGRLMGLLAPRSRAEEPKNLQQGA